MLEAAGSPREPSLSNFVADHNKRTTPKRVTPYVIVRTGRNKQEKYSVIIVCRRHIERRDCRPHCELSLLFAMGETFRD
jgi:hypothetical protein